MNSIQSISKKLLLMSLGLTLLNSCEKKETTTNVTPSEPVASFEIKSNKIYTTAHGTDLNLTETQNTTFKSFEQPLETQASIFVNTTRSHQTFFGIGGALTDSSAETFYKMNPDQQELFMKAYYDVEEGIGYSLARTVIHSADFSSGNFTYIEEGDAELKTFDISRDKEQRIPFIKKAIEAAGGEIPMYVSPWSPPAFMKSNKNMLQGGKLLPEFYQPWANYFAKFIKAYEAEGIPIWGLTIQNEPMAKQRWESCIYTAEEERDFLKNNLGPTLEKEGLGDKKIIVWDHNRDLLFERGNVILSDPEANKYVWEIGRASCRERVYAPV